MQSLNERIIRAKVYDLEQSHHGKLAQRTALLKQVEAVDSDLMDLVQTIKVYKNTLENLDAYTDPTSRV